MPCSTLQQIDKYTYNGTATYSDFDWHWVITLAPDTPNPHDLDHSGLCLDASLSDVGAPLVASWCVLQHVTTPSTNPQRWTWHPEGRDMALYRRMEVTYTSIVGGREQRGCLSESGGTLVLGGCGNATRWFAADDGATLMTNPEDTDGPLQCVVAAR